MENKLNELMGNSTTEIKTKDMIVSKNIIKFNETTIQLSNVSQVLVGKPALQIPFIPIIILVISIILILSGSLEGIVFLIVFLFAIVSAISVYRFYVEFRKDTHYLNLNLNSGKHYAILFQTSEFANEVRLIIEDAFNRANQKEMIINIEHQQITNGDHSNINYGTQTDNIINSQNKDSSIHVSSGTDMKNVSVGHHTKNHQEIITDVNNIDWEHVKQDLRKIIESDSSDELVKNISQDALIYVDKQDKQGFIEFIQQNKHTLTSDLFVSIAGSYLSSIINNIISF